MTTSSSSVVRLKNMLNISERYFDDSNLKGYVKLKPRKYTFFQREVRYLGRIVLEQGYCPDPANVEAVTKLKDSKPECLSDVRKLLGLMECYRRYTPDFASVAKQLFDLLKDGNKKIKKTRSTPSRHYN